MGLAILVLFDGFKFKIGCSFGKHRLNFVLCVGCAVHFIFGFIIL